MLGWRGIVLGAILLLAPGCAALYPVRGVPVKYLPEHLRGESRAGRETIDLSWLGQPQPDQHLLETGDTLAVYVEGIYGKQDEIPPAFYPNQGNTPPTIGFPIPVRDDGTIALPQIKPINVRGMTVAEVEERLRVEYQERQEILNPDAPGRVIVSLQRPRHHEVTVLRQETSNLGTTSSVGQINLGTTKMGTGEIVLLPAYQNDVLHAVAMTGGLPGLDAENAIYVIRRSEEPTIQPELGRVKLSPARAKTSLLPIPKYGHSSPILPIANQDQLPPPEEHNLGHSPAILPPEIAGYASNSRIIRIPIRLAPGEMAHINPDDVILQTGDIVFIESRETEIFHTGGLLGGGQFTLPRDYDLDVLGAISIATANQGNSSGAGIGSRIGGVSALNQDISVSASNVIILRPTTNGTQVPIKVDLNRALRDPKERILIQPGDYVILQYKPLEAMAAFVERHLLAGSLIGLATTQRGGGQ